MKKLKTALGASVAGVSALVVAAQTASAGPIADAVTAATTEIDTLSSDITTDLTPIYIGIIAALAGLMLLGGVIKRGLGGR